jgi:hypothetical protein
MKQTRKINENDILVAYAKFSDQTRWMPVDLHEGVQVGRIILASVFYPCELQCVKKRLQQTVALNRNRVAFQLRLSGTDRVVWQTA